MVAQSDETEAERASSLALWIAVPVKIVVVDDRMVECRTIADRDDDDGRRLNHRSRRDGLPREDPATARVADANLDAVVRYRPKVGEHRRDGRPDGQGSDVLARTIGGTCAGGVVSASSSSFIPALKALMPLAKSPITRGSFPAPNRIRIMARTTIQCIKLNEPIMTTPDY